MEPYTLQSDMISRHAEFEDHYNDGDDGNSLSGWQCENPFSEQLQRRVVEARAAIDVTRYQTLDNDEVVEALLLKFHRDAGETMPKSVFCGEGSSTILFTFCAWLKENGITEVLYIPPLYYSLHSALKAFGVHAKPAAERHAFESDFVLNLPSKTAFLLLADPVWYAGLPLKNDIVRSIIDWQHDTGSFVFIDGSFQYLRWDGNITELTAGLDEDLTLRLICPTKMLALHGYRFAYAILPRAMHKQFARLYFNIHGSDTAENTAFARVAAQELRDRHFVEPLMKFAKSRHDHLRGSRETWASWNASCGYFVFEKILRPFGADVPLMDGTFFEQNRYGDHRRINLFSPSMHLLS
ncbi:MAG TPA: aminotransferase class I/II-fold pyridoxal phosphate-dependent enzyme [Candidatus Elarobacter sp.]|jgi:histidinol-phosphate/aromatic aminotransferase/cobyric acid decarboxylase-like protein|nr:aminotransferase class I/II-fold pyridoxal phosphate-dependent enzyme [Candidatus Elarobacter sp.]